MNIVGMNILCLCDILLKFIQKCILPLALNSDSLVIMVYSWKGVGACGHG